MRPMKIGAFTAAGFSLLLASAFGLPAHAQPSQHVIATWKLEFKTFDQAYSHELSSSGDSIVFVERGGPIGARPTSITRENLAYSAIGCVVAGRRSDTIYIYPARRWGVGGKNLLTGKASPEYSIVLVFADAPHAQNALRSLEAASPAVARKVGACKSDVDLYGLQFGAIPKSDDTFSWTRNSMLGASDYTIWTGDGMVLSEVNTPKIEHSLYKMSLDSIACVSLRPSTKDLAPTLAIVARLPHSVLVKDVSAEKPAIFTAGAIDMAFDDDSAAQSALNYLEGQSPLFRARVGACSKE
jgi:hypothetical protein